ncbi:NAB [Mytilus edulis]|uniref:NAB n=1 Tax=Mytilus edulis TaxID=6550 RepID=A0A8S3TR77_MYTED|nr:NAB [Mytilus edulis]
MSEWQLHSVLKNANLLQYYDSFIRQGECDVVKLYNSEDGKFKEIMKKVGMAREPVLIRQFKNTLLEWIKDPDQKQHALFPYYDVLLNTTVLDQLVLDHLISMCILIIVDREEISKPTTQRQRNKVLLDMITARPFGTFQVFKDVLKRSDPHNSNVLELVRRMHGTDAKDEHDSCRDFHEHIVQLQKNYIMLVHEIDCKTDITDHLYEKGVLNTEEKEEICNQSLTRQNSNRMLQNKLFSKGEDAFRHLIEALRHAQYDEIALGVENTQVSENEMQLCQIDFHVIHTRIEDLTRTHDEVIPKHILDLSNSKNRFTFNKQIHVASETAEKQDNNNQNNQSKENPKASDTNSTDEKRQVRKAKRQKTKKDKQHRSSGDQQSMDHFLKEAFRTPSQKPNDETRTRNKQNATTPTDELHAREEPVKKTKS